MFVVINGLSKGVPRCLEEGEFLQSSGLASFSY